VNHPLLVLRIHGGEVSHVSEKDVDLDDLVQAGTGGLDYSLDVLEALSRLVTNGTVNQVTLSVGWDLTRAVDSNWCLDGLGLCIGDGMVSRWVIITWWGYRAARGL